MDQNTDKTVNGKDHSWHNDRSVTESGCTKPGEESKKHATEDKDGVHEEGVHIGEEEPDIGLQAINDIKDTTPVSNVYVGKRNFIHQLMDVALMMANVSQLKALLSTEGNEYFYLLLTFICLSITLQVVFTICMLVIWSLEKNLEENSKSELPRQPCPDTKRKERMADWLDRVGSVLVLFIIVSNVFIAGFGVENHKDVISTPQTPLYLYTTLGNTPAN